MRGGDYRLEVKIIQKFENKKNSKKISKKIQKKIRKFPLYRLVLPTGTKGGPATWRAFSPGSGLNRD